MPFSIFYLFCLIPLALGGILWFLNQTKILNTDICWWEWALGTASAFILAGICHYICLSSQIADQETWSGELASMHYRPAWLEYYEEAIYRTEYTTESYTDSNGERRTRTVSHRVFDHWSPRKRQHADQYTGMSTLDTSHTLTASQFREWASAWGGIRTVRGDRTTSEHNSRMISGDPQDYLSERKTDFIVPIAISKSFENRVKANPSKFSFASVPVDVLPQLFDYPHADGGFSTTRLLGTARNKISTWDWDVLNAKLGSVKKVNLILVGFDSNNSRLGQYLESHWLGGKKNDLVLVFGQGWVYVFGWTERSFVKRNLETILLDSSIDVTILPKIEAEVRSNYEIKKWKDFSYLSVEARMSHVWIFLVLLTVTQAGLWVLFSRMSVRGGAYSSRF